MIEGIIGSVVGVRRLLVTERIIGSWVWVWVRRFLVTERIIGSVIEGYGVGDIGDS